jgi:hypothetical protein
MPPPLRGDPDSHQAHKGSPHPGRLTDTFSRISSVPIDIELVSFEIINFTIDSLAYNGHHPRKLEEAA